MNCKAPPTLRFIYFLLSTPYSLSFSKIGQIYLMISFLCLGLLCLEQIHQYHNPSFISPHQQLKSSPSGLYLVHTYISKSISPIMMYAPWGQEEFCLSLYPQHLAQFLANSKHHKDTRIVLVLRELIF